MIFSQSMEKICKIDRREWRELISSGQIVSDRSRNLQDRVYTNRVSRKVNILENLVGRV